MTDDDLMRRLRAEHADFVEKLGDLLDLEAGLADALYRIGAEPTPEAAAEQAHRIVRDATEGGQDEAPADA